jgi:UDP-glucose 4-epimerase
MRIAVTGAAGFVGSAIVRELLRRSHRVVAIDNLSTGKLENLEGLECDWVKADAGEPLECYRTVDAVVHAAAHADIKDNWLAARLREAVWRENAELTRRVLLQVESQRRPFVLLSTCAVYGGGKCNEGSPTLATSPYAASKLAAEALVQAWSAAKRVDGRILRLVSCVGPRYAHGHIADFVRQAREGKIHALDNGHHRKSFVHVRDVADVVLEAIAGGFKVHAVNVTSRQVWAWPDTVALMRAMRPEMEFEVSWEDEEIGWTGDPKGLTVESLYRSGPERSVVEGVREALEGLGWSKQS